MSNVQFKLDSNGVKRMLQSPEMQQMIEQEARKKAKSDQHIKSFVGFDRAKSIIYPNTKEHSK